ncbi:MAG: peptidylprolyl isomerase [Oligoflexia bacterium]|nr:peptidylprolyl isomerase [Oligoflexia bacterium]
MKILKIKSLTFFLSILLIASLVASIATSTLWAAPKKETANKGGDTIVAIVEGQNIYKSEFDQSLAQNILFLSSEKATKEKVLKDLINRKLGIIKAYKTKLEKDDLVQRKMEDVLYHAQISKDLGPLLKDIRVSDDEVKRYYDQNKEYRTAQILFRLRANPSDAEIRAALKQALEIYETLKKSSDKFSELANKYSQVDSAPTGGDMGFQPVIRLAPEYFKAIDGKAEGYITTPVRTQFGIHLIKVIAVKPADQINSDLYKKIIYDQKRDKILNEYFASLQNKSSIKIYKENL